MSTAVILTPAALLTHTQPTIENANNLVTQANRAELRPGEQDDFDTAIDFLKICRAQKKRLEETRKKLVDPLNAHVKWINAQFKPVMETLEEAESKMNGKALAWKQEADRVAKEEADKLRKLAEDQALEDAEAAAAAGDTERAEALVDLAASTPVADTQVRGRGHLTGASGSSKFAWKGEVADIKAICAAVASGELPVEMIKEISKTAMNKLADTIQTEGIFHGVKLTHQEDLYVK